MAFSTVPEEVADLSLDVSFYFVSQELAAVQDFEEADTQTPEHSLILYLAPVGPDHLGRDQKQPPLGRFDGHAEDKPRFRLLSAFDKSTSKAEIPGLTIDQGIGR
jgi:hypothetical protein